ncbi:MAG: 2-aminoethylphosphonate ABC transporter permease, partial [Methylobacteriaceae bacterium]|nr:2-aminoethylphosphonate ABC transporter permease [Methylobacteriaceae bacterium]
MADATLARLSRPSVQTDSFWVIPPLLVLAVLFFYPLSLIATQAFTNGTGPVSLTQFGAVLGSAVFRSAL